MEVHFFSKDVDILITVVEEAWWQGVQVPGHLKHIISSHFLKQPTFQHKLQIK